MSNVKTGVYAELLEAAHQGTLKVARAVPEQARLYQPAPGRPTPLWLVGHLANSVDKIALVWMLGQEAVVPLTKAIVFAPDFAGGKPPTTDASMYPSYDETIELYEQVMRRVVEGVRAMSDEQLPDPLQGNVPEQLRQHFSSNQATLTMLVGHDAYHRGQVGLLSKLGAQ
jgi:hypothetical protein